MMMPAVSSPFEDNPLVKRGPMHDEAKFDITAMIDLVFMMNIFFLVTTVTAALAEIDLPTARHCAPADRDNSVIFTILAGPDHGPGQMTIDEGLEVLSLTAIEPIERRIREAAEDAARANRKALA